LVVYSALNLCLGIMANESDLYDQFSDFSCRKILFALMSWEEKEEEEGKKRKKKRK